MLKTIYHYLAYGYRYKQKYSRDYDEFITTLLKKGSIIDTTEEAIIFELNNQCCAIWALDKMYAPGTQIGPYGPYGPDKASISNMIAIVELHNELYKSKMLKQANSMSMSE
ncbi:hypothetical protein I2494_03915 [Budviciaceae bacterium BWR-B9]|uniref:Uncharacterized protein n=1 Tax=Limnobaculum allomyrinae TaxID=2791986 RepID=A0ABS1IMA1_9GAMM|nr:MULTISPECIES: hypothetical protein [Limnobaculum]MBK5142871.1 hypothetical protein [Limnobaculum allomyrinae]MBV7690242.1 hypothetical protein [Limnobaculum sp. M2-1]